MCGHSIELHRDIVHTSNNDAVSTPLPNLVHQLPITLNDSNNNNYNQGLPAPNHRNFLPIIDDGTSEKIVHTTKSNEH